MIPNPDKPELNFWNREDAKSAKKTLRSSF
jgi:hypothetical protein